MFACCALKVAVKCVLSSEKREQNTCCIFFFGRRATSLKVSTFAPASHLEYTYIKAAKLASHSFSAVRFLFQFFKRTKAPFLAKNKNNHLQRNCRLESPMSAAENIYIHKKRGIGEERRSSALTYC